MAAVWSDPALGRFEYSQSHDAWVASLDFPSFRLFTYSFAIDDAIPGRLQVWLHAIDENDLPSPTAIALLSNVIANQSRLIQSISSAIWEDFSGGGPESGMWWHSHLEDVEDAYDSGLPALDGPTAILAWMRPMEVIVRDSGVRSSKAPVIEITFAAAFEAEHSVGVLTDGVSILGIGYALDVEPFES